MNYQILYPEGKEKALTFSYDDGQIHDRRLVELFNRYGLKATFHLNSGTLDTEGFLTKTEVPALFKGHEVACHGVEHLWPRQLSKEQLVSEIWDDRKELERITGGIVNGMSYAFGEFSDQVIDTARNLGILYSRTVDAINGFNLPADFLRWNPSVHHNDVFEDDTLVGKFLDLEDYYRLPLLYIWGHSFEFARENTWDKMEALCERLANHEDTWYATNKEIYEYVRAVRNLETNAEKTILRNTSNIPIWVKVNGEIKVI